MTPAQPPSGSPVRVLIVDDHPAIRQGLALLLAPEGVEVCAEAGGRTEALAHWVEERPDLAIVDLSLENEDGLPLISELRRLQAPVLVYSMHNDAHRIRGAFAAGALGYVTKRELHAVLVEAIREVAAGRRFLSPHATAALAGSSTAQNAGAEIDRLSVQEQEVYRLLGRGSGTLEIADTLKISAHTVESYYARIRLKLRIERMQELRRHAIRHFHDRAQER